MRIANDRFAYKPVVTVIDALEIGACFDGVLQFVTGNGGAIAVAAESHRDNEYVQRAANGYGNGNGYGYGYGNGNGNGYGYGDGYGYGNGYGYGDGYGNGYGNGNGYGDGYEG